MGDYGNEFMVEHPMGEATRRALRDTELSHAVQQTELVDPSVVPDLSEGEPAVQAAAAGRPADAEEGMSQ